MRVSQRPTGLCISRKWPRCRPWRRSPNAPKWRGWLRLSCKARQRRLTSGVPGTRRTRALTSCPCHSRRWVAPWAERWSLSQCRPRMNGIWGSPVGRSSCLSAFWLVLNISLREIFNLKKKIFLVSGHYSCEKIAWVLPKTYITTNNYRPLTAFL